MRFLGNYIYKVLQFRSHDNPKIRSTSAPQHLHIAARPHAPSHFQTQTPMSQPPTQHSGEVHRRTAMQARLETVQTFINTAEPGHEAPSWKLALAYVYQYIYLIVQGIQRTELPRRAAALTYTTILSIFPLLAVVSSSASLFYNEAREDRFMSWISTQLLPAGINAGAPASGTESEVVKKQKEFTEGVQKFFRETADKFRASATGIGVFGFIGLLIASGMLFLSIESVVNETWKSTHRGGLVRSLTNFVTVLVMTPLIIGLAIAGTTIGVSFLSEEKPPAVVEVVEGQEATPAPAAADRQPITQAPPPGLLRRIREVTRGFGFLLPLLPVLLNGVILGAAYAFLPKTTVKLRYAFLGGILASSLWEIARFGFAYYVYQSSINRNLADAIGLSVVFLIWIYITWMILLTGNLFAYTSQNFRALWTEKRTGEQLFLDGRLVVICMALLARRFRTQGGGMKEEELRISLGLKEEAFRELIGRLRQAKMITTLVNDGLAIAHPPEQIQLRDLLGLGCNVLDLPIARRGRSASLPVFQFLQEKMLALGGDWTLSDLIATSEQPTVTK